MSLINLNISSKIYSSFDEKVSVFDNFNISFKSNGFYAIFGESGCGKSTLLNILGLKDLDYKGNYSLEKKTIDYNKDNLDEIRSRYFSYCFQENILIEDLTITQNINIACINGNPTQKEIYDALRKVNLNIKPTTKVKSLSGGERQRVCLAIALLRNTPIILCDEITGNLDEENSDIIFNLLKELSISKLVILVSHDYDNCKQYSDYLIDLEETKKIESTKEDTSNKKLENTNSKSKNFSQIHKSYKSLFSKRFWFQLTNSLFLIASMLLAGESLSCISFNKAQLIYDLTTQLEDKSGLLSKPILLEDKSNQKFENATIPYNLDTNRFNEICYYKPVTYSPLYNSNDLINYTNRQYYRYLKDNESLIAGSLPSNEYELLLNKKAYEEIYKKSFVDFTPTKFYTERNNEFHYLNSIEYKVVGIIDEDKVNTQVVVFHNSHKRFNYSNALCPLNVVLAYNQYKYEKSAIFPKYSIFTMNYDSFENVTPNIVKGSLPNSNNEFIVSLSYLQKEFKNFNIDSIELNDDYFKKIDFLKDNEVFYEEVDLRKLSDEFKICGIYDNDDIEASVLCTSDYLTKLISVKEKVKGFSFIEYNYNNLKIFFKQNIYNIIDPELYAVNDLNYMFTSSNGINFTLIALIIIIALIITIIDLIHIIRYKKTQIILLRTYGYKKENIILSIIIYFTIPLLISMLTNFIIAPFIMKSYSKFIVVEFLHYNVKNTNLIKYNYIFMTLIYLLEIVIISLITKLSLKKIKKNLNWYE